MPFFLQGAEQCHLHRLSWCSAPQRERNSAEIKGRRRQATSSRLGLMMLTLMSLYRLTHSTLKHICKKMNQCFTTIRTLVFPSDRLSSVLLWSDLFSLFPILVPSINMYIQRLALTQCQSMFFKKHIEEEPNRYLSPQINYNMLICACSTSHSYLYV